MALKSGLEVGRAEVADGAVQTAGVLEEGLLPLVEHARVDPVRLADLGHRLPVQQVLAENPDLFLATGVTSFLLTHRAEPEEGKNADAPSGRKRPTTTWPNRGFKTGRFTSKSAQQRKSE